MDKRIKSIVKKLVGVYFQKLKKFENHSSTFVIIPCYRYGKTGYGRRHISFCHVVCEFSDSCVLYKRKVFICYHIGCPDGLACLEAKDYELSCKKRKVFDERKKLEKFYKKYLKAYRIYRGLKKEPERTMRYLINHGKIPNVFNEEKSKGTKGSGKRKSKKNLRKEEAS